MSRVFERHVFHVAESADNASVVYSARQLLEAAGFDKTSQYLIASAASELSTNIIRYAEAGTLTLLAVKEEGRVYVEIIADDNGPGISDMKSALTENFTTGGGLGLGLPSVKRIMDEFEIKSEPGVGTTVTARKWLD